MSKLRADAREWKPPLSSGATEWRPKEEPSTPPPPEMPEDGDVGEEIEEMEDFSAVASPEMYQAQHQRMFLMQQMGYKDEESYWEDVKTKQREFIERQLEEQKAKERQKEEKLAAEAARQQKAAARGRGRGGRGKGGRGGGRGEDSSTSNPVPLPPRSAHASQQKSASQPAQSQPPPAAPPTPSQPQVPDSSEGMDRAKGPPDAPLSANGIHRWKKVHQRPAKRQEQLQRAALESFAATLMHSTSPLMAPLRALTGTSLPHIKVDQRYGRRGAPHTAIMQFVVAPTVVNYRPEHFTDVSPGDLMEFHHDLALVLDVLQSPRALHVTFGKEWHPYAVPYAFVSCDDHRAELSALCPTETPNSRSEPCYEDDVVRDVTAFVLATDALRPLREGAIVDAMRGRVDLGEMYAVLAAAFGGFENFQITARPLRGAPPKFFFKTSAAALRDAQGATGVVEIDGDPTVWDEFPIVSPFAGWGGEENGKAGEGCGRTPLGGATHASPPNAPRAPSTPTPPPHACTPVPDDGGPATTAVEAVASDGEGGKGKGRDWVAMTLMGLSTMACGAAMATLAAKKLKR